jgi:two-component system, sensor histidine kinase and response regulator
LINLKYFLKKDIIEGCESLEKILMGSSFHNQDQFPVRGLNILLVEDDQICRNVLEKILVIHGMVVKSVETGEAALEFLNGCCGVDLVLMDIQLPGIDGIETTKKIRMMENGNAVPVIAVTALAKEWKRERFFPEGFDDYLPKPVDTMLLFEIIRKQIDHYSEKDL